MTSHKTVHINTVRMYSGIILLEKKARVLQNERYQKYFQNVVDVLLCFKCASNDDERGPAVRRNGIPDHNSWLRACVERNSEGSIGTLS
ncbi:hypothetical protein TNCV_3452391 [Trichonephila clavipes]|nr:hypothetical protein TNCV_3452391 [Trichonephila clavipes]